MGSFESLLVGFMGPCTLASYTCRACGLLRLLYEHVSIAVHAHHRRDSNLNEYHSLSKIITIFKTSLLQLPSSLAPL